MGHSIWTDWCYGGTATEGKDDSFNILSIPEVTTSLLQNEYYYGYDTIVNLEYIVNNIITITNNGVTERDETIELQFSHVGLADVIIDDTLTITIND